MEDTQAMPASAAAAATAAKKEDHHHTIELLAFSINR